ncbi:MAG: NADH-quinone oxidoreductase subunit NuoH [Thermoanaerobaculia bacterium]|nr:NADH-quinone oxidoreductase subunit NuoH [Thermoanaerobaculia bacterium]MBP9824119.1 NADH-quinone oxidoreductase subunit NuoH [Thermoanaerobaculia bacterium]
MVFTPTVVAALAMTGLWLFALINVTPIMLWLERRAPAFMQDRLGPNRLGPLGLFQAIADVLKFIFKEDINPAGADKTLFILAPTVGFVASLLTYLVIPFGPEVTVAGHSFPLVVIDSDAGMLLFLALSSLGVYGLVLAGYSSNSKWSMMGGIRASAQMVSYELALTVAVLAALIPAGSLNLSRVVDHQIAGTLFGFLPAWNIFLQPLGFLVFLVAAFAETNRLPFDLPEAESELVAGYHTEYGGLRMALFYMGEYQSMAILSALGATLYFGGWSVPGVDAAAAGAWIATLPVLGPLLGPGLGTAIFGFSVLLVKTYMALFFFIWVRWTFPRFRYDQLMHLGWKVLLPLALLNFVVVAALAVAGKI